MNNCPKAVLFMCVFIIPIFLHADEFTTMKDMLIDMAGYVGYLEDSLNQEVVHMQADIITDNGASFTRILHESWTYGITAFGDWRVKDLDIVVYKDVDGEWVEVESDDAKNNFPRVEVKPLETGAYLIEIEVYKWANDYTAAHYGMLIYHEVR